MLTQRGSQVTIAAIIILSSVMFINKKIAHAEAECYQTIMLTDQSNIYADTAWGCRTNLNSTRVTTPINGVSQDLVTTSGQNTGCDVWYRVTYNTYFNYKTYARENGQWNLIYTSATMASGPLYYIPSDLPVYPTTLPDDCPVDPCEVGGEWARAEEACGDWEFVTVDDAEECTWHCNTCDDQWAQAQIDCPHGYIFENQICTYRCMDCLDFYDQCEQSCINHGGVMLKSCTGSQENGFDTVCVCQDAFQPELLEEGTPPPATPDNDNAQPDPTLPDPDTSDPWSEAIKKNLDTVVKQNNDRAAQLDNIAGNIKKSVDNQVAGDKNITDAIREGNKDLSRLGNKLDEIDDKLDQQKTDAQGPDVPSFDSSVGEAQEWSEYDDGETLGQTRSGSFQSELSTLLGENPSPISGVLTASGDPCLTGNVTIHNNTKAVSICFNKPWMEQGYSIMKLIFIGLGYLQAALLVMKAIKL